MIPITDLIASEQKEFEEAKMNLAQKRLSASISPDNYLKLFLIQANKIILSRNIAREFEITKYNKEVINQIYHYLTGNEQKFNGSIYKGIMLVGRNGIGKTLILKAYCEIIRLLNNIIIFQIHSKKLQSVIEKNNIEYFEKRPMFIDDIGKESLQIVDYGTKIMPVADLIALRYDNGALTFTTCNYNMQTLEDFYGKTTTDRFKEMFNIIELGGESFRK